MKSSEEKVVERMLEHISVNWRNLAKAKNFEEFFKNLLKELERYFSQLEVMFIDEEKNRFRSIKLNQGKFSYSEPDIQTFVNPGKTANWNEIEIEFSSFPAFSKVRLRFVPKTAVSKRALEVFEEELSAFFELWREKWWQERWAKVYLDELKESQTYFSILTIAIEEIFKNHEIEKIAETMLNFLKNITSSDTVGVYLEERFWVEGKRTSVLKKSVQKVIKEISGKEGQDEYFKLDPLFLHDKKIVVLPIVIHRYGEHKVEGALAFTYNGKSGIKFSENIFFILSLLRDIISKAVEAIKMREEREKFVLFSVIEKIKTAIGVMDGSKGIVFTNQAFKELVEEYPELMPAVEEELRFVWTFKTSSLREIKVKSHYFLLNSYPTDDGKLAIVELSDITREKESAKEKFYEYLSYFSVGIAHDLKNPLTAIRGYAELVMQRAPETKDTMQKIITLADRMYSKIEKVLEIARASQGVIGKRIEKVNVCDVIKGAVESLKDKLSLYNIKTELKLCKKGCYTFSEPTLLLSSFENIISNSADAIVEARQKGKKCGTISISVECTDDNVKVVVSDDGIGMDRELKEKIFDPFFTTKEKKGTGIGLTIVYITIKLISQGDIYVESEKMKGTKFTVLLPKAN